MVNLVANGSRVHASTLRVSDALPDAKDFMLVKPNTVHFLNCILELIENNSENKMVSPYALAVGQLQKQLLV